MADLLLTGHPASFSVPAVAERAGVSVRTVYRHFPTKQLLLDGLAELGGIARIELVERAADGSESLDHYVGVLPDLWTELYDNAAYLRAQAANPILREARSRRIADRRERIAGGLRSTVVGLNEDDIERLTSLIQVLGSSWTMLDLVDEAGHPPVEAAAIVQWAIRALLEAAQRDHEQGAGSDADD